MELDDLLKLLRYYGVSEFESSEYKIKLDSQAPVATESVVQEAPSPPVPRYKSSETPRTMYHNPSLWPSGKPPEFPK